MAVRTASGPVGTANVDGDCEAVTASEDFARYLGDVPGCFIRIGNGTDGPCGPSLHNPGLRLQRRHPAPGAAYWIHLTRNELPSSV